MLRRTKCCRAVGPLPMVLLACAAMLAGCASPASQPSPEGDAYAAVADVVISVTGEVLPVRRAELAFAASGITSEVLVREGERVSAGQVLAILDAAPQEAAVEQARTALAAARAQLDRVLLRARGVDIQAARAALAAAREGVLAAEREAAVHAAAVGEARVALGAAQANLALARLGPSANQLEVARLTVEQAKAQLYGVQGSRDAAGGQRDKPGYQAGTYEAAEGQVMAAEWAIEIAEAHRRELAAGPRHEAIAVSEANVSAAEAAIVTAETRHAAATQAVAVAQAGVAQAEVQLAIVLSPPRAQDVAIAESGVAQAEAALAAAEAVLDETRLVAPWAGTIAHLGLRQGEYATAGMPVVSLGDLDTYAVETTDLDELDVARVREGASVAITFDALPGVTLAGTVERIAPKSAAGAGGTTFVATIAFDETDPRLRWGMTAFCDLATE